ncbi:PDZ domain-containing protein [Alicyclobacillus fastidiosus]|uniref:PDZ domain-containing protein n=1 Tax=Alicyclobacillus fastidiosus TaxID=392011 RepID=A0ABV5AJ08_9BACL|nr:PDZ domain-containing protein [Alicyclobacillus fastidiosus]WEH09368.1 PDZ domain-containing protein [Alicyclobacillus fastidiosus]
MHHWTISGGWGAIILVAIIAFLCNPLHYVATALVIWDLIRNIKNERIWFGIRVTRIIQPVIFRYMKASAVGLVGSLALVLLGAVVSWQTTLFVAVLSIALGLIRSRFLSTPTAISIALSCSLIAKYIKVPEGVWYARIITFLQTFEMRSWLLIALVACLAELFLQWWNQRDAVFPAVVTSKRGRRIGALKIQLGFSVPLVVWMTPIQGVSFTFHDGVKPWLVAADHPVALCVVPAVFGMHALFTALRPERVMRQFRRWNLVYAAILAAGFAVAYWLRSDAGYLAAPILVVLMEVVRSVWRRVDESSEPAYAPASRGVMVLYTIQDSLAHRLGILPGEVITHVNQTPVHSEYDLHFAFEQNPAYAKFQVLDARGEVRLIGNPVYEGERHQLGLLVVVPDEQPALNVTRPFGFLETLYLRRQK